VDIIHQFFRFFVALADLSQSANLFGAGSVEENMESIGTLPQEIRGASSDENTVAFLRVLVQHLLGKFHHVVGVEGLVKRHAALVAASPENLSEPGESAVAAFVAVKHGPGIDVGDFGDLFGESVVPKFPAEALS